MGIAELVAVCHQLDRLDHKVSCALNILVVLIRNQCTRSNVDVGCRSNCEGGWTVVPIDDLAPIPHVDPLSSGEVALVDGLSIQGLHDRGDLEGSGDHEGAL